MNLRTLQITDRIQLEISDNGYSFTIDDQRFYSSDHTPEDFETVREEFADIADGIVTDREIWIGLFTEHLCSEIKQIDPSYLNDDFWNVIYSCRVLSA